MGSISKNGSKGWRLRGQEEKDHATILGTGSAAYKEAGAGMGTPSEGLDPKCFKCFLPKHTT